MKRSHLTESFWAATLAAVVVAALSLAACGGSDTATTDTAAASPSVAATISSTPTPTYAWTPGTGPIAAMTYPPQAGSEGAGFEPATNGWDFTPTVDIEVTALGFFDDGQDGLRHSHPVGIFDAQTEKLLVKAVVQPQSPLDGVFRFVQIERLVLRADKSYVVASFCRPPYDPEAQSPSGATCAAEIAFGAPREAVPASKLTFPEVSNYSFLNANFKFRPVAAPVAAATIPPQEGTTEGFTSSTNGWEFTPTVDIQVTHLGYYDDSGDGLRHPHPVGIFDVFTQKLLITTTVEKMSPLDGAYRFAKIQPLTLAAGTSYIVATVSYPPFDPEVAGPTGLVFAPEIEYVGYREALTDEFVYPASSPYEFITANFKYISL
jgi:hypothetical protein